MISNQIITNCLSDAKNISKADFALYDSAGTVIAKTEEFLEISKTDIIGLIKSEADTQEINNSLFIKIKNDEPCDYVLLVKGTDDKYVIGKLIAAQLSGLFVAYKDKVDKNSFFQNLILDNLLLVDIYNKAQKLHIDSSAPRIVFEIELSVINNHGSIEMVKELFNVPNGDFVTTVDEDHIIAIRTVNNNETYDDMEDVAEMLVDTLRAEAMTSVRVSYGTIADDIKGVSKSYKEAAMALDVGKIFYAEKSVISYKSLGIGRLIYQLPTNLCEMYIDEVFTGGLPDEIDEEILNTINRFLDNSLNVSETSRQLYIHRNTLVYRIEKLLKATGMDVRNFDDALSFRIAMMVMKYVNYTKDKK